MDHPINNAEMVRMLQKYMGDSGTLTKKKAKFDKKNKPDCAYNIGKKFYRDALEDLEEAAKCAGTDTFLANSPSETGSRAAAEDNVRNEMVAKMGESFDVLVMAAEASKATYDDQARTISTLTATNAELTSIMKKAHR